MIILATISINAVLGENGIIKKAESVRQHQLNAEASDNEALDELDKYFANAMAGEGNGGSGNEPPSTGNIDPETGWDLDKVNKVTSEDNVVVPVPIGYTASTVDGEKSVSTGFVIKEGTDGSLTSGINEFVWVPVPEISDLYDETNNAGQLWEFSDTTSTKITYPTIQNSGYREPDVGTLDDKPDNLQQAGLSSTATASDFKVQLQNEFNSMVESVEKYGGFYIGRYETGNLSKEEAVVQKGNTDINNQSWYTMYRLGKTIGANENVVSSMIWGCQWDATLRWMQTSTVEKVKNFATDESFTYGNYYENSITYVENGETKTTTSGTSSVIPTGSAEITNINNIYDMAGNVWDLTLSSWEEYYRAGRGFFCSFIPYGPKGPASFSLRIEPVLYSDQQYFGTRSCLYIALSAE